MKKTLTMENEYLCFIRFVGTDIDEKNTYELLFTDDIDTFWGENFEYVPCCLCNELIPMEDKYNIVKVIKTDIKLNLIQDSCCFSFQDAMDGIIAIAWENIDGYDEYPEEGRLVLTYGMEYEDVENLLSEKNIVFNKD